MRRWKTLAELADMLDTRAKRAERITITADTAAIVALKLRTADSKPDRDTVALAICRKREAERCSAPCFECRGKANIVVRLYGQSIQEAGMERLSIVVSDELATLLRGYAKILGKTPETIAAELIYEGLAALGVVDGELTVTELHQHTRTDGTA